MKKYFFSILKRINKSKTIKSGIWYTISDFLLKGMAFITIPIFTRLLSVEDYGIVSIYTTMVGIFVILSGADLHASIGVGIIDFKKEKDQFLSSILFLSLLIFTVQIFLASIFGNQISHNLNIPYTIFLISVLAGYLSFIFNFYSSLLIFEQRYKLKSFLSLFKAILEIILSIFFITLLSQEKYLGRIYGNILIGALIASIIFVKIILKGKRLIWKDAWRYSLKIGIPLIPHNLSGIILAQFDRLAIQGIIGARETGLYSYAYNLGMVPLVLLGATNSAWVPWFYKKMSNQGYDEIKEKAKIYNHSFLIFLSLVYILMPEIGVILAPENYNKALSIFPIIVASYYMQFLYTIYVNYAFFRKKTYLISIGTLLAGVINIILNIWLIPIFGYEIAAMTTLISYFFLLVFHTINTLAILKEEAISWKYTFSFAVVVTILSLVNYSLAKIFGIFSFQERLIRISIFGSLFAFSFIRTLIKMKNSI